jgi:hypothetical protein
MDDHSSICVENLAQVNKILCDREAVRVRGIVRALKCEKQRLEQKIPCFDAEPDNMSPFNSSDEEYEWLRVLGERLWRIYAAPFGCLDTVDNACLHTFLYARYSNMTDDHQWIHRVLDQVKECALSDALLVKYGMVRKVNDFISDTIYVRHQAVFAGLDFSAPNYPVYHSRQDMLEVLFSHLDRGNSNLSFEALLEAQLF